MGNYLQVTNLARAFAGVKAVDCVNFTVKAGETLALVGPNGAGKSTVVQLVSGIERIDSGTVHLSDERIDGLSPDKIFRLGVARSFQTSRVFPALSVWESVLIGTRHRALMHGAAKRLMDPFKEMAGAIFGFSYMKKAEERAAVAATEALRLFGEELWDRRNDRASSLSYANRRRLEIARLLASDPKFLLLDEPAAGMNPSETAELTDLIVDLRRRQPDLGILIVEHKLSLVRKVADRVLVLNQGRSLAEGSPEVVFDLPEVVEVFVGKSRKGMTNAHHG